MHHTTSYAYHTYNCSQRERNLGFWTRNHWNPQDLFTFCFLILGTSCDRKPHIVNVTMAVGAETVVQKICPLPCELSFISKNIPCPEEGCKSTFLNSSNLEMHLIKHHKKQNGLRNGRKDIDRMNCQYHCPAEKCLYNINSDRHFTNIKYLKQHYLKVHAEKKFLCKKCEKGFSTEAACNVHTRICGLKFTCSCGCNYMSYEALITHAKRKNHTFDANVKLWAKGQSPPSAPAPLPSASPSLVLAVAVRPRSVDVGVQTERPSGGRRARRRRSSAQTQTWSVKRSCAGTQTPGDYILKRAMRAAQIPVDGLRKRKKKKSMETQTAGGAAPSSSPPPWGGGPKHSSGTQTPDPGFPPEDDSPPRFDPMLPGAVVGGSRPAETQTESALSHIETQTNTEDLFEQLLHANMCTQTCGGEEEEALFSELGFSDIQTQTVAADEALWREDSSMSWSTALVSTETQTAGHCSWMSETSHMETQTDVDELRRLIAELTKHDIEGE